MDTRKNKGLKQVLVCVLTLTMAFSCMDWSILAVYAEDDAQSVQQTEQPAQVPEQVPDQEVKMPAQDFHAVSSNGVDVRAQADEGVFPAGTEIKVDPVSQKKAEKLGEEALGEEAGVGDAVAVDITFFCQGDEIQPAMEDGVHVTIKPEKVLDGEEFVVVHEAHDGTVETIDADVTAKKAVFDGSEFSVYAIVSPTDPQFVTFQFWNGSDLLQEQKIKAGDDLFEPSTPTFPAGTTTRFEKWYYEQDPDKTALEFRDTEDGECLRIDEIPQDYIVDGVVKILAYNTDFYHLTFYDDTGYYTDGDPAVLHIVEVEKAESGDTTYDLSQVTMDPRNANEEFFGWSATKGDGNQVVPDPVVTVTEDAKYYPVLRAGVRVSFNNNAGGNQATFWPPVIVHTGETIRQVLNDNGNPVYQTAPKRSGYTFAGWYTNEACTGAEYDLNQEPQPEAGSHQITLYAKWDTVSHVTYKVNFWRQAVNDDKNAADGFVEGTTKTIKKYDYVTTSEAREAVQEDGKWYATLTNEDISKAGSGDYNHYKLNAVNSSGTTASGNNVTRERVEVPSDSSGVLDVYYDRQLMTYKFEFPQINERFNESSHTDSEQYSRNGQNWSNQINNSLNNYSRHRRTETTWTYDALEAPVDWPGDHAAGDPENVRTFTGLYGQSFAQAGYDSGWPETMAWKHHEDKVTWRSTRNSIIAGWNPDTFSPDNAAEEHIVNATDSVLTIRSWSYTDTQSSTITDIFDGNRNFKYNDLTSGDRVVQHYLMNTDGTYPDSPTIETTSSVERFMISAKFPGAEPEKYTLVHGGNETTTNVTGAADDEGIYETVSNFQANDTLKVYHARNLHDVDISVDGTTRKITEAYYDAVLGDVLTSDVLVAPTKAGYTFDGWYLDEAFSQEYDPTAQMPDGNFVLFPKYKLKEYVVHVDFDPNGIGATYADDTWYFIVDYNEQVVTDYQTSQLGVPSDYEMVGWFIKGGTHGGKQWVSGHTVSDADCGGTFVYADAAGHTKEKNIAYDGYPMMTIEAHYRMNDTISVVYDAGGATAPGTDTNTYYTDSEITAPSAPTNIPAGKFFVGWKTRDNRIFEPGQTVTITPAMIAGDGSTTQKTVTFTALYSASIPETYIRYDANAGTGTMDEAGPFAFNEQAEIAECGFEREGYDFANWNTKADGSGETIVPGNNAGVESMGVSRTDGKYVNILYAQWTPKTYTVQFDKNADDATGSMADQVFAYDEQKALSPNGFGRTGYDFVGWAEDPNATTAKYADKESVKNLAIEGTVKLYAVWNNPHVHAWTYEVSGATITATCGGTAGICEVGPQSMTLTAPAGDLSYDGSAKAATIDADEQEGMEQTGATVGSITYVGTGETNYGPSTTAPTNAGTYHATVTVTNSDVEGSPFTVQSSEFTIAKVDSSVTTAPAEKTGLTYNGTDQPLVSAGEANGGTMKYFLSATELDEAPATTDDGWKDSLDDIKAKDAGTYYVYYYVAGDNNHNDTAVAGPVSVTIAKKPITVTATDTSSAYKAELATLSYTVPAESLAEGDAADSIKIDLTTTADKNAQAGTTFPITGTVKADSNPNYEVTVTPGIYTITKAEAVITVTGFSGKYDGALHGLTVTVEDPSTDPVTDLINAVFGTGKEATVYYSAQPLTADNYKTAGKTEIEEGSTAYKDVTNGEKTIYYYVDLTNYTADGEHDGVSGSKIVEITPKTTTESQLENDQKPSGPNAGNTLTYNGEEQALVTAPEKSVEGYTVKYRLKAKEGEDPAEWATTPPTGKDAATYEVEVLYEGNDDNHASFSGADIVVTIEPKEVGLEWSDLELTYSGAPQQPTATATGLCGEDTCTVTVEGEQTNAGENYTATATGLSNSNYKLPEGVTTSFKIVAKTADKNDLTGAQKATANENLVYSGDPQDLVTAPTEYPTGYSGVKYSVDGGNTWTTTVPAKTDAGNYTVQVKYVPENDNYAEFEADPISVSISPKTLTVTWNEDPEYTGSTIVYGADVTGIVGADAEDVTITYSGNTGTNVGEYHAGISIGGERSSNYQIAANDLTHDWNIKKASATATAPAAKAGLTYNGDSQELISAGSTLALQGGNMLSTGTMKYFLSETQLDEAPAKTAEGWTEDATAIKGTDAGTYYVYYYVEGDADHSDTAVRGPVAVTIAPKDISENASGIKAKAADSTYTGSPLTPAVTVTFDNGIFSPEITLEKGTDYTVTVPAGSGTKAEQGIQLTVTGTGNYTGSRTVLWNINKAEAEEPSEDAVPQAAEDLTYNREAQCLVKDGTGEELSDGAFLYKILTKDGEEVPSAQWSATKPSATDAGEYVIAYYVKGDANHNDIGSEAKPMGTFTTTIGPKTLTEADVTFSGSTFVYQTDTPQGPTITVKDAGITLTLDKDYTLTDATATDVGTYTAVVTGTGNYTGEVTKQYEIVKSSPAMDGFAENQRPTPNSQADGKNLVYNKTAQDLVNAPAEDLPEGYDGVKYSLDGETWGELNELPTGTDAGTYSVYYKYIGDANHADVTCDAPIMVTIDPKPVTVTPTATGKTYGDNDPEFTYEVADVEEGDTVNVKLTRESGEDIGSYAFSITENSNHNYAPKLAEGSTFTIGKKPVTPENVTISFPTGDDAAVYNGEPQQLKPEVVVDGKTLTEGEDYDLFYPDDITNAGDKEVKFIFKGDYANATEPGEDGEPQLVEITGTFTIGKKPVTIKAKDQVISHNGAIEQSADQAIADGLVENAALGHALAEITLEQSVTADPDSNEGKTGTIIVKEAKITDGTGADVTANYAITYNNEGKLTIRAAQDAPSDEDLAGLVGKQDTTSITINTQPGYEYILSTDPNAPADDADWSALTGDEIKGYYKEEGDEEGTYTFEPLDKGTAYYVHVRKAGTDPVDDDPTTPEDETDPGMDPSPSGTVPTSTKPDAPATAEEGYDIGYTDEVLTAKDGYEIFDPNGGADGEGAWVKEVKPFTPGGEYEVRVAGADGVAPSDSVPFTAPDRPDAPDAVDKEAVSSTDTTVTVDPTVAGQEYILVPKDATPEEIAEAWKDAQVSENGEPITFSGLTPDTEYVVITRIAAVEPSVDPEVSGSIHSYDSEPLPIRTAKGEKSDSQTPIDANDIVTSADTTSITVEKPVKSAEEGTVYEYRIDGGEWQTANSFDGLEPGTTHTVEVRKAETDKEKASAPTAVSVTTTPKPLSEDDIEKTPTTITIKDPQPNTEYQLTEKDEDGNEEVVATVTVDEDGNVTVKPEGKAEKNKDGDIVISGLDPEKEYEITVAKTDDDGNVISDKSEPIMVETPAQSPEDTPNAPSVEVKSDGTTVVDPADNGSKYIVKDEDGNETTITVDEDGNVKVEPKNSGITAKVEDGKLVIDGLKPDTDYEISEVKTATSPDNKDSDPSTPVKITTPKSAPEGPVADKKATAGEKDGSIKNVDDTMEYSTDGGKTWTPVPAGATEITGLGAGEVLVRYEAVPGKNGAQGQPASEAKSVTVESKVDQAAPTSEPSVTVVDPTTIVVEPASPDEEYSVDGGKTWVKPNPGETRVVFDNLQPGTEYEIVSRKAGTDDLNPSPASPPARVSTPSGDRSQQMGEDGTPLGRGASAEAADAYITNANMDVDPPGSVFLPLQLKSVKQTKKSVKVQWKKVSGAKKYVLYGNKCGTGNKMKKIKTLKKLKFNVKKAAGKKVKKGKYYKFVVVALDENNNVVATSKVIHVVTKGSRIFCNHKSIIVKAKKGKKVKTVKKASLKVGKKLKLKCRQVKQNKHKKVSKHTKVRFESTNRNIASVNKKGVITARSAGTCKIYAYAQNGVSKVVKVTVR